MLREVLINDQGVMTEANREGFLCRREGSRREGSLSSNQKSEDVEVREDLEVVVWQADLGDEL